MEFLLTYLYKIHTTQYDLHLTLPDCEPLAQSSVVQMSYYTAHAPCLHVLQMCTFVVFSVVDDDKAHLT